MKIRNCVGNDANKLTSIAIKSKSYWNYSEEFIEKCIQDLTVTPSYIQKNIVRCVENIEGIIIGFYGFTLSTNKLDALFIHPDYIGKGIGNTLWNDLIKQLKEEKIDKFRLDSEPYATKFYLKMGASIIGEIESTVFENRKLPLMEYIIEI
ncbi:GNAT family N-acetyltransferase [Macrococcus sp. DPC7161]|uniref:GNAT family N-acetyltransferase n=1 Tax=Macrococcus sp. DPC7161 TaxID=2507060 RepID=UPI00100BE06B|nr:GNAT family N-acetyltransferase [Macrococcus sp. DPC7161]RXK17516.1 GNAT family N-acetyltransferase [Macrococcus sp. DPC7161]